MVDTFDQIVPTFLGVLAKVARNILDNEKDFLSAAFTAQCPIFAYICRGFPLLYAHMYINYCMIQYRARLLHDSIRNFFALSAGK